MWSLMFCAIRTPIQKSQIEIRIGFGDYDRESGSDSGDKSNKEKKAKKKDAEKKSEDKKDSDK